MDTIVLWKSSAFVRVRNVIAGAAMGLASLSVSYAQDIRYELIAKFENVPPISLSRASVSPDGARVAIPVRNGSKELLLVNGTKHVEFDKILYRSVTWSEDAKELLYVGERSGAQILVREGKEIPVEGKIVTSGFYRNPTFSSDGTRVLWVSSSTEGKARVYVDGVPGAEYDRVSYAVFRPAGNEPVYLARADCWILVVDGAATSPRFDEASFPKFSADGKVMAYLAKTAATQTVVVDGRPLHSFENITEFALSPDGSRVAIKEWTESAASVIVRIRVDGLPVAEYPESLESTGGFLFSQDSKHLMYVARDGEAGYRVVIDGVQGPLYAEIWPQTLRFTNDGTGYAYAARTEDGKVVVVSNAAAESRKFNGILGHSLTYRPDGKSLAYVVVTGLRSSPKHTVVVDGKPSVVSYDEVGKLRFHPSGKVVYKASRPGRQVVVVGTKAHRIDADQVYDDAPWAMDASTISFRARRGSEFYKVTIPVT